MPFAKKIIVAEKLLFSSIFCKAKEKYDMRNILFEKESCLDIILLNIANAVEV